MKLNVYYVNGVKEEYLDITESGFNGDNPKFFFVLSDTKSALINTDVVKRFNFEFRKDEIQ